MKGFDTLHIKSAVKSHNKFDLSRTHLTTMDFGQIVPLFVEETVPGDKITVNGDFFSRMAPLVKPTYGKFQFKTVAGYVPYYQVASDADAWIDGKTTHEGSTTYLRYFTIGDFCSFLRDFCCTSARTEVDESGNSVTVSATSANCDWSTTTGASATPNYYFLTSIGKYWVKILNSLGYALPAGVNYYSSGNWYQVVRLQKLNAMPLLAFFKLYNDYMSQSQRYNTSILTTYLNAIRYNKPYGGSTSGYTGTDGRITPSVLNAMFSEVKLNYENDYFTSAWQQANTPLATYESVSPVSVPSPEVQSSVFAGNKENALATIVTNNNLVTIGQRALDFLRSFDDWVRRNNYSGSRAVQQVFSRFGIKSDEYRADYAHVISTDSMPIQVGDVTATADAANVPLGDYAGKGIMSGNKSVHCEADDYGVLLILGYFTVTPMNAYGYDRRVLRNQPLDFYTPEFDGIGADAISIGEVYENALSIAEGDFSSPNNVFGFTERYNSYRYGRDVITGEFRNYRNDADMNTWHTGRNLSALRAAGTLVAQSSSMNTMEPTGSQYNRIFSITDDSIDHFYMTARFNVDAVRPMMNLNQVVKLGEGDTAVPRNGNVIS